VLLDAPGESRPEHTIRICLRRPDPAADGVYDRHRECLDHVIVFSEASLYRHLRNFTDYYHRSRTHLGLQKDTPESGPRPSARSRADRRDPRSRWASSSVRASRRLSAAATADSGTVCGSLPWLIDSRLPLCSEIAATIRKTGSANATLRPPREEPHSLATSSLAIRLHRLRRVCLILTRTSFAAERIQIEFARTTVGAPPMLLGDLK
jgi:hypothetical protein